MVTALGVVVVFGLFKAPEQNTAVPSTNTDEVAAIRTLVTEFGTKLQMVSLLASTEARTAAMQEHYSAYVAPELLTEWYPEGSEALGRYTSSPWPERIEVVEVVPTAGAYRVEANIIEVAAGQNAQKEAAAVQPVTLALEKRGGQWMIVKMEKGAYAELPQRRTIVGFWECLPHKDQTGPQTEECAFGIAVDQSDGHYAIDTRLMSTLAPDYPMGTKVRISGVVTPATHLSSEQKYDIDGIISATEIEEVE